MFQQILALAAPALLTFLGTQLSALPKFMLTVPNGLGLWSGPNGPEPYAKQYRCSCCPEPKAP